MAEALKRACVNCPFREESALAYDEDAMKCLSDGMEPSCHAHVGYDAIFSIDFPTTTVCTGYLAWERGEKWFAAPKLATA